MNLPKINTQGTSAQIKKQNKPCLPRSTSCPRPPPPTRITATWISITTDPTPVFIIYVNRILQIVFFPAWLLPYVRGLRW